MPSKAAAQRRHARSRALERYDCHLSRKDLIAIRRSIQKGKAKYLGRQSNRITVWLVTLPNNLEAPCVYDKKRQQIVTFLPPESHGLWSAPVLS